MPPISSPRVTGPLVIGHRGAPGYRPEHSRSGYEHAIAQGADAVEPDLVPTRDGVLVIRHENEIGGTTNVADHPEFADRQTTKTIEGVEVTGWFTEDFDWAELAVLRGRERLPELRPRSAAYDDEEPLLRFRDLLTVVEEASVAQNRPITVVAELKHATYFDGVGLPLDELLLRDLAAAGWDAPDSPLIIESFEATILDRLRASGVHAPLIYLLERRGAPADLVARDGAEAALYAEALTDEGLAALAGRVAGISVDKALLIGRGAAGGQTASDLVARAHAAGLLVFTWTLRPENTFLTGAFRRGEPQEFGDWRGEFGMVFDTGVDGVFADHPDLAVTVRAERAAAAAAATNDPVPPTA